MTVGTSFSEDDKCLRELYVTDPRDDKERIEKKRGPVLRGSCSWLFTNQTFLRWRESNQSSVLWLRGSPGKGETMLAIATIDELTRSSQGETTLLLPYFFCENPDPRLNSALNIIRSILYMIIDQRPSLKNALAEEYKKQEGKLFTSPNALVALWRTLKTTLSGCGQSGIFIILDALDECDKDLVELLESIVESLGSLKDLKVKWLVTSRNETEFRENLASVSLMIDLDLQNRNVATSVSSFIDWKVEILARKKLYRPTLLAAVSEYPRSNSESTFLWVSVVCKELDHVSGLGTMQFLNTFSGGLDSLYDRMLEKVLKGPNKDGVSYAQRILEAVTLALRPLKLPELAEIVELPELDQDHPGILEEYLQLCGSILTVSDNTVKFIHQSAREYFSSTNLPERCAGNGWKAYAHGRIGSACFEATCSRLSEPVNSTMPIEELSRISSKWSLCNITMEPLDYVSKYWIQHLELAELKTLEIDSDGLFFQPVSRLREIWIEFHDGWNRALSTPLHFAAHYGWLWLAKQLLIRRNGSHALEQANSEGMTPLFHAVANSDQSITGLFLEVGANPNVVDEFGDHLLSYLLLNTNRHSPAPKGNAIQTAELLLSYGADPNARFKSDYGGNRSALDFAFNTGELGIGNQLLLRGADPYAPSNDGEMLVLLIGPRKLLLKRSSSPEWDLWWPGLGH